MKTFDAVILFSLLFVVMIGLYGNTNPTGHPVNGLTTIQSPLLAPLPKQQIQNCQNTDAGCIAQNLALATAYVGWSIVNIPVLLIYAISTFANFLNVALGFANDPNFNPQGVPVVGFFFSFLIFIIIAEAFKWFRGVAAGF